MSVSDALGHMDIPRLLQDTDGLVSFSLFDSGTCRQGKARYSHEIMPDAKCKVWLSDQPKSSLVMESRLKLTPRSIAFFGLYLGDGAKAARPGAKGVVSLSQREPHLANFAREQFIQLFGDSITFTHRVNEDALFFMTDERRKELRNLREKLLVENHEVMTQDQFKAYMDRDIEEVILEQAPTTQIAVKKHLKKPSLQKFRKHFVEFFGSRELMMKYLEQKKIEELAASGIPLAPNDRIVVNIRLPGVKGSREEGKSSRSDELDVNGLNSFRPLFLRMLSEVEHTISENIQQLCIGESTTPWLEWYGPPHSHAQCLVDAQHYVEESLTCRSYSAGKDKSQSRTKKYDVHRENDLLVLKKNKVSFTIPRTLSLTPLLCLFFGLYLAEGATAKWKLFNYFAKSVGSMGTVFTASEPSSVKVCIMAMRQVFQGTQGEVNYWRLKVGSKYFPETVTVGNKIGAVVLRRGEKGQGSASGFEIVEALKDWVLISLPDLQQVKDKFDHLEYTGAGIPRIDLFYPKGSETYLFSLMRNLVIDPLELDKFRIER